MDELIELNRVNSGIFPLLSWFEQFRLKLKNQKGWIMRKFLQITAFLPCVLAGGMLFAQAGVSAPAAMSSAPAAAPAETVNSSMISDFQAKFDAYKASAAKIQKLQEEFEEAGKKQDHARIREIQAAAPALLKEAEQTFMAAVPVALNAYANSDGKNAELNQFMLTYANYLLTQDNYDEAYRMFTAFLSKGMHKSHPEIFEMAGVSAFGANRFNAALKCFDYAKQTGAQLSRQAQSYADSIKNYYVEAWGDEMALRQKEAQADNLPRVLIRTSVGDMVVELFENEAPNTVKNFVTLVESGFYSNLPFHRVLAGFMAQGGCPKGDGTGGPGYTVPEEYSKDNARKHFRGSLAMARSMDPNSAGSQFYITLLPNQSLDANYTVFGRVIDGMGVLSKIERIDPQNPYPGQNPSKILEMKVIRKQNHDYSNFTKGPDK